MGRLIIFQALAVNAGSLLTPIGNPQNILLWSRSGLSFLGFIGQMAPFGAAMMLSLLALTVQLPGARHRENAEYRGLPINGRCC